MAGGMVPVRWFPLGTVHDLVLPAGLAAERQSLVASQREKLCFFAGSIKRNRAQLKTELEHVRTVPSFSPPYTYLLWLLTSSLPIFFLFIFCLILLFSSRYNLPPN
jgi:hypothetical protein